jgi:hypothetical protein
MQPVETPQWMLNLFKSIDALDMSESGGLSCFAENIEMHFGSNQVHGLDAVKEYFLQFDAPFKTVHHVTGVWQLDNMFLLQGSADIKKADDPSGKAVHVWMLNIYWLDEHGKVELYIVTFPPAIARAAGMK